MGLGPASCCRGLLDEAWQSRFQGTRDIHVAIGDRPWLPLQPVAGEASPLELMTCLPLGRRVRLNAKPAGSATTYATLIDFAPEEE